MAGSGCSWCGFPTTAAGCVNGSCPSKTPIMGGITEVVSPSRDTEIADLRAKLAEAEAYVAKLKIDVSGYKGTIDELVERVHAEMARAAKATAACAEMRALLERGMCEGHVSGCNPIETYNGCAARALLARIDLGRGWVGPEVVRRVVERAVAPDGHCHLCIGVRGKHMEWCPVPDLDALLGDEKGGVK